MRGLGSKIKEALTLSVLPVAIFMATVLVPILISSPSSYWSNLLLPSCFLIFPGTIYLEVAPGVLLLKLIWSCLFQALKKWPLSSSPTLYGCWWLTESSSKSLAPLTVNSYTLSPPSPIFMNFQLICIGSSCSLFLGRHDPLSLSGKLLYIL